MIEIDTQHVHLGGEELSDDEIMRRKKLGSRIIASVPAEALELLQIVQPAIGCVNLCNFCSQVAGPVTRELDARSLRTMFGSLRGAMKTMGVEKVGDGRLHKEGVVFPYLDNDIGSYPHLVDYLEGVNSLGGKTRISTVGWSRNNEELQNMHERINNDYIDYIDGVRFSLTPYTVGWRTNRDEYLEDFSNALATYTPFIDTKGTGKNSACIEVRFKPDVQISELTLSQEAGYSIIKSGEYTAVLLNAPSDMTHLQQTEIASIKGTSGVLSFEGYEAVNFVGRTQLPVEELISLTENLEAGWQQRFDEHGIIAQKGRLHLFENEDGPYFAFNPLKDTETGTFSGVHYYPRTEHRAESGVLDARRPLLNTIMELKSERGLKPVDKAKPSLAQHASLMRERITDEINAISGSAPRRAAYMREEIIPMVDAIFKVLKAAQLPLESIFDYGLVMDTGVIVNQGKAVSEFRGLVSKPDMPLTPNEERGYGDVSQSSVRGNTWRLAPMVATAGIVRVIGLGKKSQAYVNEEANKREGVSLGFYEWNPQTFNNIDTVGNKLRSVQVLASDILNDFTVIAPSVASNQHLRPGSRGV